MRPTRMRSLSRVHGAGVIVVAALMLAACSTGDGAPVAASVAPQPDQVLVVNVANFGPALYPSATTMSKTVGASSCTKFELAPNNRGGGFYEIHFRVPASQVSTAIAALTTMRGVKSNHVLPLAAYGAAPVDARGVVGPFAC